MFLLLLLVSLVFFFSCFEAIMVLREALTVLVVGVL